MAPPPTPPPPTSRRRPRTRRTHAPSPGVRTAPLLRATLRMLPLWLAWLLIVVLGRGICHLAQRIPPVVRLVRHLRARNSDRHIALNKQRNRQTTT